MSQRIVLTIVLAIAAACFPAWEGAVEAGKSSPAPGVQETAVDPISESTIPGDDAVKVKNAAPARDKLEIDLSPKESPKQKQLLEITGLTTSENAKGVSIAIEATGNIQYTAFKLEKPMRLVLDLPRMRGAGMLREPIAVNKGVVKSIRPLYFDQAEILRLEIVLNEWVPYQIEKPDKNKIWIGLQPTAAEAAKQQPTVARNEPVSSAEVDDAESASMMEAVERLQKTGDLCDPILTGTKEKFSFDLERADLRSFLKNMAETGGFNLVISPEVTGTVTARLVNVPWNRVLNKIFKNNKLGRECFEHKTMRIASQEVLAKQKTVLQGEAAQLEKEMINICGEILVGDKKTISLDFQQADLRNILRFVSEVGGFNLVISPEVTGKLSMRLMNIPLSLAFSLILRNHGLGQECSENIVRVGLQDVLTKYELSLASLEKARADAEKTAEKNKKFQRFGEELNTLDSIPADVYRKVAEQNPSLYADLENYGRLFRERTELAKMSLKNYFSLVKFYKKLIDDANNIGKDTLKTVLQGNYDTLKYVGIIWEETQASGLIETKDSRGYTVRKGAYVGPNFGTVDAIDPEKITVLDRKRDYQGNVISNTYEIKLTIKEDDTKTQEKS